MLKNTLKVALRMVRRESGYVGLNVMGLAVGLACCALILIYVRDELSYDRHHERAERIVRVTRPTVQGSHWAPVGPPVGRALAEAMQEVETYVRIFPIGDRQTLKIGDRLVAAPGGVYADSTVFDVFTLPVLAGDSREALTRPSTVVLTQSTAERFFGDENPVGRVIHWPGSADLTVTAVVEDPPETTHLPFNFLVSMETFVRAEGNWLDEARTWAGIYTYLLLETPDARQAVEARLPAFVDRFFDSDYEEPASTRMSLELQPLTDIHLHSQLEKEYRANGNVLYVVVLGIVAVIVLVVASVNFVNLTTARSGARLMEVGVRKALGSSRMQLARQFLVESLLMTSMALAAACVLVWAALPLLNGLTGKSFTVAETLTPGTAAGLVLLAALTGVASGLYPAWYLSGMRPSSALRQRASSRQPATLRSGLVVFQFALSIFMLIGTATVYKQLHYVRSAELGFDKERVLAVAVTGETGDEIRQGLDAFKQEVARHPSVASVSYAADSPGDRYSLEYFRVEGAEESEMMRVAWGTDHDYARTLGLAFTAGRDFSERSPADTAAWIINESAARRLGLQEPIGRVLHWGDDYSAPIVGMVEDFHFASLHAPIEPLVIPLRPGIGGTLLVRVGGDVPAAIEHVRGRIDALVPGAPFEYHFLDDAFDDLYRQEQRLSRVFGIFAGLAVLIACLGLFGLAAYTAARRRKEIGIRKVLGASVPHIVGLLSGEFVRLVGIAFVIAAPVGYFVMVRWLDGFAYRTNVGTDVLASAGAAALVIALATVSYHAVRAALSDPVKSIRYE